MGIPDILKWVELWRELHLDQFWMERLLASREGTRWDLVLTILSMYWLLDSRSEFGKCSFTI